ncbi:MAG: phosphatidylglycerol lysyltransferase domain-containing protein [Oscillospiraceae bacterium]|nr:phosphatidylglycerol lysyltransferase domain-containing protein [Oscillospiraceae bacterium]
MLDFKVIELSDKPWVEKLLRISDFRGCEYCFANNMAWRRMYDTKITRYKDFYISLSEQGSPYFTFPAGGGDYSEVFGEMKKYSEARGYPLVIGSVTPDKFPLFEELFPKDSYVLEADEDGWDYVYSASDLAELKGKKYHGKRNHLKKLLAMDYSYEPLTEKDFDDCISFAVNVYNRDSAYDDKSKVCEQFAINTYFENFHALGLMGGVLRVEGRIAAFTIGERINSDTLGVHIEKAEASVDGAYPAVNQMFAASAGKDFAYINREEDLGIEGLRKAKRSYHPAFMIEKHTVRFK